jgi:Endonuclease NucS
MLVDKERTIHSLLRRHPDLIDKSLKGFQPEYEVIRENKRFDLLFRIRNRVVIVEIKRSVLTANDVEQLTGYCRIMSGQSKLAKQHFLVGKRPSDTTKLAACINAQSYRIVPKYLVLDIPVELIWDSLDNRYVAARDDYSGDPRYQNYIKLRV